MGHLVQIGNDAIVNRGSMQRFKKDDAGKQDKRQQPAKWPPAMKYQLHCL